MLSEFSREDSFYIKFLVHFLHKTSMNPPGFFTVYALNINQKI